MSRPHAAAAAVVLLWLAVLTVAFHGCGRLGCGGVRRTSPVAVLPRKMLLAVTTSSFDAASPPTNHHPHHHHHHPHQHQHQQAHHHHDHHHHASRWNRHGIRPSSSADVDPRYGVEKRLVPTGPNPLHH